MTMPTAIEFIADRLPRVTAEDVRRFADTVEIRDASAFAAELQAFIPVRVEAVTLPATLEGETVAIERAHVCTAVTYAHLVGCHRLEYKKKKLQTPNRT